MKRPALAASTIVLLVRHAETPTTGAVLPGRKPGLHLSDAGRQQAERLAQRLGQLPRLAAVYSSPRERARETAAAIARPRGLAVRTEHGLDEVDIGAWTGLTVKRARCKREWALFQRHPSGFRFPGGESFVEMQARVASTLGRLVEGHPGQTLVAVSHGDPIKAAIAHALGLHLDLFQRNVIAPASVTAVLWRPEGPVVLTMNSVDGGLGGLGRP
ncbi:MAG: histidine phosphatase family protein [Candidatus Methylomirabilia bacterium]